MQVTTMARKDKHMNMMASRPGFRWVHGKSPEGEIVAHLLNTRDRMIDALHDDGLLTAEQHRTATALRDAWEQSGMRLESPAVDPTRPHVDGGGREPEMDGAALRLYEGTMRQMAPDERRCLKAIVCTGEHPAAYGKRMRCDGLAFLCRCLDKAERWVARYDIKIS